MSLLLLALFACKDPDGDGFTEAQGDCNEEDAAIGPHAVETCNGVDDDCDGQVDEQPSDGSVWYVDQDGDGAGDPLGAVTACEAPGEYVANPDDCDDEDPAFHPGAAEDDCSDPRDYNCDGSVGATDADGDGFLACQDCDDSNAQVNAGAEEVCDEVDNDCDGLVDNEATDAFTWYIDVDQDSYGSADYTELACEAPEGWVDNAEDCDDTDDSSFPGGTEVCDGADNDCNGEVDDGSATAPTWYLDADEDGYGDASVTIADCEAPSGYVEDATDCDDDDEDINPGVQELCDEVDNDCDGDTDEDDALDVTTWYADTDGDGFGDANSTDEACEQPSNYVNDDQDCDDGDEDINPDATEVCDSADNDCDGDTDEDEEVLGEDSACPGVDCADILSARTSATDGAYWIDPDGNGALEAYCDMSTDSGGWTLVMKQAAGSGYGSPLAVGTWTGWSTSGQLLNETDATLADANMVNAAYSTLTATDLRMTASTTWTDTSSGAWTQTVNDTPYNALSDANANQLGNLGTTDTTPWAAGSFTDETWTSTTTGYGLCWRAGPWFNQTSYEYTDGGIKWGWFFNNECGQSTTDTGEGLGCCGNSSWYRASTWTLYLWAR